MSKLLYVDFDDVLCETALAFTKILPQLFGKLISFDDILDFDLKVSFELTPQQHEELMRVGHEREFLEKVAPVPGAIHGMNQLKNDCFEIIVVTGRPPHCHDISLDWLKRHDIPFDAMIEVDKYGRFTGKESKQAFPLEEFRMLSFFAAVEDSPDMAAYLVSAMKIPVLVFERPWNVGVSNPINPSQLINCSGWNHIIKTLRERDIAIPKKT